MPEQSMAVRCGRKRSRILSLQLAILLSVGALILPSHCEEINTTNRFEQAVALINAQDWTNAVKELSTVIQQNPTNATAYEYRAAAFLMSDLPTDALADLNETLRLDSANTRARLSRGMVYRVIGKLDDAIRDLTDVITLEPTNELALQSRGICLMKKQQPEKAVPDLGAAIRLNANDSRTLYWRGTAFLRIGKFEDALRDFRQSVKIESTNDSAWNNLAWLLATCPKDSIRNGKEAVKAAHHACKLSHWRNGEYIDTLAAAYAEAGDFSKAIEYENRAIAMKDISDASRKDMKASLLLFEKRQPKRDDQKTAW